MRRLARAEADLEEAVAARLRAEAEGNGWAWFGARARELEASRAFDAACRRGLVRRGRARLLARKREVYRRAAARPSDAGG